MQMAKNTLIKKSITNFFNKNLIMGSSRQPSPTVIYSPPPPPPTYTKPFLRFAMVIPVPNLVDCTIRQGSTTQSWTRFEFGHFSEWIEAFDAGSAEIVIASAGQQVLKTDVALTPGPLVIVLRPDNVPAGHKWPPTNTSLELIAASYVAPPTGVAAIRIFNLSPDTLGATLAVNQKPVANSSWTSYSVGSKWLTVPNGQVTFEALDSESHKVLASVTGTAPQSPLAATVYLIGLQIGGAFATTAKLLPDAPIH